MMMLNPVTIGMVLQVVLVVVAAVFAFVQALIFWILKGNQRRFDNAMETIWGELKGQRKEATDQGRTLVRIDTRLDNVDELRKRQDHDHTALRDMAKIIDKTVMRVEQVEKELDLCMPQRRGIIRKDPEGE